MNQFAAQGGSGLSVCHHVGAKLPQPRCHISHVSDAKSCSLDLFKTGARYHNKHFGIVSRLDSFLLTINQLLPSKLWILTVLSLWDNANYASSTCPQGGFVRHLPLAHCKPKLRTDTQKCGSGSRHFEGQKRPPFNQVSNTSDQLVPNWNCLALMAFAGLKLARDTAKLWGSPPDLTAKLAYGFRESTAHAEAKGGESIAAIFERHPKGTINKIHPF